MATNYTTNARLAKPAIADRHWDVPINANADFLDGIAAIGRLLVTSAEQPSASLGIRVTSGAFERADGTVGAFSGSESVPLGADATVAVWLGDDGQLGTGPDYPATPHVRLARVTTGPASVASILDERVCLRVAMPPAGARSLASGSTAFDALEPAPSADEPAASVPTPPFLVDATAGHAGVELGHVGQPAIDDNFASLAAAVNALIAVLRQLSPPTR